MRRAVSILLLLAFAGVASGAIQSVHQRQHQRDAAAWVAAMQAAAGKHGQTPAPPVSSSDCILCLILTLPFLAAALPALLAGLILLAIVRNLPVAQAILESVFLSIACRGPPAL